MCPYCRDNVKQTEGGNLYCMACGVLWVKRDEHDFMMTMEKGRAEMGKWFNAMGRWVRVPDGCMVVK